MLPSRQTASRKPIPDPGSLASAFATFTQAAGSLEESYGDLQKEVARLSAQLEAAHRQLGRERETARRVQALGEVSRLLAHEIRNPLASMELFVGLLAKSGDLGEQRQTWLRALHAGIRLMAASVNNVLQFNSPSPLAMSSVDIAELVRGTIEFLLPVAQQASVSLVFEDHLAGARILADPHRLQQVFLNISLNAIRAIQESGELRFSGRLVPGHRAELAIADTGPGIPDAHRDKVFEQGFTTRADGAGLGLAFCKRVMQQHGGDIRLEPSQRGCRFVLTLNTL